MTSELLIHPILLFTKNGNVEIYSREDFHGNPMRHVRPGCILMECRRCKTYDPDCTYAHLRPVAPSRSALHEEDASVAAMPEDQPLAAVVDGRRELGITLNLGECGVFRFTACNTGGMHNIQAPLPYKFEVRCGSRSVASFTFQSQRGIQQLKPSSSKHFAAKQEHRLLPLTAADCSTSGWYGTLLKILIDSILATSELHIVCIKLLPPPKNNASFAVAEIMYRLHPLALDGSDIEIAAAPRPPRAANALPGIAP
jgi:hypothetical protein